MPFNPGNVRKVNALGGKRPQATGIVLIPKNNGNVLKTSNGSTANYGGNTKFGLYPNVGMSYLFQNKIGVGSLFYNTTTPSQVNPSQVNYPGPGDGPGIQVNLNDLPYVPGPDGTFTFTATSAKLDGGAPDDVPWITQYRGFAYVWGGGPPDQFNDVASNYTVSQSNYPFGLVSGNRKILNDQAEIERIVTDDDGAPGQHDIFINIYSDQLDENALKNALSNLEVAITDLDGTVKTFDDSNINLTGSGAGVQNGIWIDLGGGKGILRFRSMNSNPQINFIEGQQYSVVVST